MKRNSLLLLIASMIAAPAWSQMDGSAPAPTTTPAVAAETTAAVALNEKKDLISVDFPNEEIRTVLRNVADLFELNLVVPETLVGRTSIKLRNVTWRQIFKEVLTPIKYTFVEDQNIIRVVSEDSLAQQPTVPVVFVLNYARANEILPTISRMVDTSDLVKGSIQVDQRSNALVIRERPAQLEQIRPIIEKLDVATAQVMIETKFFEIAEIDGKHTGVNWSSLSGYRIGTKGPIESTTNHVESYTAEQGAKYNPDGTLQTGPMPAVIKYTEDAFSPTWGSSLKSIFEAPHFVKSTFSAAEFGLVLSFLETNNNVRLVSNPTVVTMNNVEATINIGDDYPLPNYTYNQERGSFEVAGFTFRPIGINLKVTPQVNSAGVIKLSLVPEMSNKNGDVSFGSALIPIIATRKVVTQVSLKSGHTMGIGGLMQTTTTKDRSKVPVFGDIPVLGHMFRSKGNKTDKRNLVIFITAKTLGTDDAKVEDIFNANELKGLEIKASELPGHRPAVSPFADGK